MSEDTPPTQEKPRTLYDQALEAFRKKYGREPNALEQLMMMDRYGKPA